MWKSIKKFFKWIAGKISSIWDSIKNLWSSNKANLVSDNELSFVELSNGKIGLVMLQDIIFSKNKDQDGNVIDCEFRSDFNDESLYITGRYDSKTIMEDGNICLSINSVGTLDGFVAWLLMWRNDGRDLRDKFKNRHTDISKFVNQVAF